MTRRIVVVGAGLAGTAAAFAARAAGAGVVVVGRGPGATELTSGAVDDVPWYAVDPFAPAAPLAEAEARFASALGAWRVGGSRQLVATLAGRLRPARAADRAVLDLAALPPGTVVVPRCPRAGWDADALAATWNDDPLAARRGLRFAPVDATLLRHDGEARAPDVDLAARHDDPERLAWLAERLASVARGAAAVLVGPWLGVASDAAAELTRRIGIPVGETLSVPGGPAGERLARACARLRGASEAHGAALRIERAGAGFDVHLAGPEGAGGALRADAVVLAVGGLVGGGVALSGADPGAAPLDARAARAPFVASVASPAQLGLRGRALEPSVATSGAAAAALRSVDAAGVPDLEAVGFLAGPGLRACDDRGEPIAGLFLAGDAVEGRARTVLQAVRTGVEAGAAAAS